MLSSKNVFVAVMFCLLTICFLGGCVTVDQFIKREETYVRTVASYEEYGRKWGTKHWNEKLTPGKIDPLFVEALIDPDRLDFFWVHSDLKDAFKKGYRLGYQERTADLVLGPNLTEGAARIGNITASKFVKTIETFESEWAETLKRAINVFITLISEGSQADREEFIRKFTDEYAAKYNKTREMLKAGGFMTQVSEGGTMLYIDASKTLAVLDIPSPNTLKTEIYHQTFRVMGDEWGKRLSHNLIKRDELIDLLRRSKTALQEVPVSLGSNLGIIQNAFENSYGTDAENVFRGLIKDAGYTESPASAPAKRR